jgi:DnaJ like chaperone protein
MNYWGKVLGGVAGFAMGGPMGAMLGAALGHAADNGTLTNMSGRALPLDYSRMAAQLRGRDHIFTVGVTVLSAKLAKCDGPVNRREIDAFKASFPVPAHGLRQIGLMFDKARDSAEGYQSYAQELGQAFADDRGMLAQVLAGLTQIARADGPLNARENAYLATVAAAFGLDPSTADRARRGEVTPRIDGDPYLVLGIARSASNDDVRARWKSLMRENHPDSLASQGVPEASIAEASAKVATINAAYDVIKRERKL